MNGFSEPVSNHGAWEYAPGTGKVQWAPALYRIHGVSPEEFEPSRDAIRELIHPDDRKDFVRIVADAIEARAPFAYQHRIVLPEGGERIVLVRGAYLEDAEGTPRLIGTTQDVTGRPGDEERLWHLANHDSLSGLFNRRRFMEELTREVGFAERRREAGAVLMLDLDRFKDVNDSLGHMAGDSVLARVAEQLRNRLRATDTLARLGGDEFAIVLPGCTMHQAKGVATEILDTLKRYATVRIGGMKRGLTASIGIAPFGPDRDHTADELMIQADLAMYRAKAGDGSAIVVFDEEMSAELAARMNTEGELRYALSRGELRVVYQPIVSLADGTTIGCEALVRWDHPERGLVGPGEFIGIAEETGLIDEVGAFVLNAACRQAAEWRRQGYHLYVSVNVSPRQLIAGEMAWEVARALKDSGLPAALLCLEVTENSLLADSSPLVGAMRQLKRLGVRMALDDFGGGASSLGLLRVLPLDQIKIDRMFVEGIADQPDDRAIVAAVLSMAGELGMTVVAEGIETEHQQGQLRDLGCEYAQGFLYARPTRPADLDLEDRSGLGHLSPLPAST